MIVFFSMKPNKDKDGRPIFTFRRLCFTSALFLAEIFFPIFSRFESINSNNNNNNDKDNNNNDDNSSINDDKQAFRATDVKVT